MTRKELEEWCRTIERSISISDRNLHILNDEVGTIFKSSVPSLQESIRDLKSQIEKLEYDVRHPAVYNGGDKVKNFIVTGTEARNCLGNYRRFYSVVDTETGRESCHSESDLKYIENAESKKK